MEKQNKRCKDFKKAKTLENYLIKSILELSTTDFYIMKNRKIKEADTALE